MGASTSDTQTRSLPRERRELEERPSTRHDGTAGVPTLAALLAVSQLLPTPSHNYKPLLAGLSALLTALLSPQAQHRPLLGPAHQRPDLAGPGLKKCDNVSASFNEVCAGMVT